MHCCRDTYTRSLLNQYAIMHCATRESVVDYVAMHRISMYAHTSTVQFLDTEQKVMKQKNHAIDFCLFYLFFFFHRLCQLGFVCVRCKFDAQFCIRFNLGEASFERRSVVELICSFCWNKWEWFRAWDAIYFSAGCFMERIFGCFVTRI